MHATPELFSKNLPNDFLGLERAVTRNAGTVIKDPFAILVLRFIADRTFGWSKTAEFISASQFLNGIVTRAGEWVCAGLPLGKTKLYACLNALKEAGAIVVETIKGRTRYTIPLEFAMQLKTSKAEMRRQAQPERQEDCDLGNDNDFVRANPVVRIADSSPLKTSKAVRNTNGKERTSPFRTIAEEENGEAVASLCAGSGSIEDVPQKGIKAAIASAVAKATDRARVIADRRAARAAEHNPTDLFEGFAAAARATWPEMGCLDAPTAKQRGQLRNMSRAWTHPGVTFLAFLEWSAANWRGVWASKMEHVKDPTFSFTDHPDIGTLIYFHKAFRDSYDRRASQRIRAGLTREDEIVRRLMFRGFSHADAKAEAVEVMAKDKKREDLDALAADLNARVRRVERKEQDIDNRIAIGRSYQRPVKPVAPTKRAFTQAEAREIEEGYRLPPLPPIKDHHDD